MSAYLFAWLFFLGLSLGALGILMLYQLTGGDWMNPIRPYLNAALLPMPILAVLFVPILFEIPHVFPWSGSAHLSAGKAGYLNEPFFIIRAIVILSLWTLLSIRFRRAPPGDRTLYGLSAAGLILYAFTMTVAAVDWISSLQPEWSSTALGLVVMTGQGLGAFAFAVACAVFLPRLLQRPLAAQLTAQRCGDLGNLLLTFVMTWMYLAFMQFLIIWAEDLPRETVWYLPRVDSSWRLVSLAIVGLQFAIPFLLLLFRPVKRNVQALGCIALLLLAIHIVNISWLVLPSVAPTGITYRWMDLAALSGIGALWGYFFSRGLPARWVNG